MAYFLFSCDAFKIVFPSAAASLKFQYNTRLKYELGDRVKIEEIKAFLD